MTDAWAEGDPESAVASVFEMSRSVPTWTATPEAWPGGAGVVTSPRAASGDPRHRAHAAAAMGSACRRIFVLSFRSHDRPVASDSPERHAPPRGTAGE